jgi:hypothetical protein
MGRTLKILICLLFWAPPVYAEARRNMNALVPADQRIQELLDRKAEKESTVYEDLFESADGAIRNHYTAIARPDLNIIRPSDGFLTGGLRQVGNPAVAEMASREGFALYAVRVRLHAGIQNCVRMLHMDANVGAVQSLKSAQKTLENLRQQSITVGSGPEPVVMQIGYDVITDVSQVWWTKGGTRAGVVHTGLLSGAQPGISRLSTAVVHFSTTLGHRAPRAFFGMPVLMNSVDLGLSHVLAPGVEGQIRFGRYPGNGSDLPRHEVVHATVALPL